MDKPLVVYDRIDNPTRQTHKLRHPVDRSLMDFGLAVVYAARYQKGGPLIFNQVFPRDYEFYCISHLVEGHGVYWSEDEKQFRKFDAGKAVIITPGFVHLYGGDNDVYIEDTICFTGCIADTLKEQGILTNGIFDLGHARRVAPIIERSFNPSFEEQVQTGIMLQKLIMDIYTEKRELSSRRPGTISQLLMEFQRTPEKWWTVSEMAERCCVSESHFRRIFEEYTGIAPKLYIDRYKAKLAAELLSGTDLTLAQIASRLGYIDPFHFSRRFKSITGMSPQTCRAER